MAASSLRFGLTPVFRQDDLALLDSLKTYLESACGRPVELVSRRTYREITIELLSGRLDAAWICGYPYVANRKRLDALAAPIWRGAPLYRSYLVVSKDRDVSDIDDLRGDIHAFSDPDSNSGYLVTQALLASRDTNAEEYFQRSFFTYGHRNVVRAVASGLAQSGSVDGYVVEALRKAEPALVGEINVVWRSAEMGFPPIACLREMRLSPEVESIRAALLSMADHPDGRAALALMDLDGFADVPSGHYNSIEADMRRVERDP